MENKISEDLLRFARRWRITVYAIAVGLPVYAVLATAVVVLLNPSPEPLRHSLLDQLFQIPLYVAQFNWPYLILDLIVSRRMRRAKDNAAEIITKRSATGSFVGMTIPYAFVYLYWPQEMSTGAHDAGQGIGILLVLCGWFIGPIAATYGWVMGPKFSTINPSKNR